MYVTAKVKEASAENTVTINSSPDEDANDLTMIEFLGAGEENNLGDDLMSDAGVSKANSNCDIESIARQS